MVTQEGRLPYNRNRILNALPDNELKRLMRGQEIVNLDLKELIYEPNEPLPYVLFPLSGIISIVMEMENGAQIEVATVGNEGMVGVPLFLGAETTPGRAFSQVPGQSLRVPADVFKEEVQRRGKLEHMLQRYTQALFVQTAQSTACNRLHTIEQRGARWLLMTHDRVDGDQFPLTQEFLAQMLGVRRASVSEVAGEFKRAGLIAYARGNIAILDRQGLEDASCECYRVVRDEYERLLGGE